MKNLKNSELEKVISKQLASGRPVIFHKENSKNPDYIALYLAQTKKREDDNVLSEFLGSSDLLIRGIQIMKKDVLKNNPTLAEEIKAGILSRHFLKTEESTTPFYDGQKPISKIKNGVTSIKVTAAGEVIYRQVSLSKTNDDSLLKGVWKKLEEQEENDNDDEFEGFVMEQKEEELV